MNRKKQIRRMLVAAGILTVVAVAEPAQAQQQGGQPRRPRAERIQQTPEQHVERRVARLTQQLALSTAQATRVRTILLREAEQTKGVFDRAGISGPGEPRGPRGPRPDSAGVQRQPTEAERAERQARMELRRQQMDQIRPELERIRTQAENELTQVLNQQQRQKYQELRATMQRGRGGPRGAPGHRPAQGVGFDRS
jgi:hypothetical protein